MTANSDISAQVESLLRDIETRRNIEILLAVEMGSWAWGLDGPASDHDIRVIYREPPEQAFALFQDKDIRIACRDSFGRTFTLFHRKDSLLQNCAISTMDGSVEIELSGWSLPKTLKLAASSNVQIGEITRASFFYRKDLQFHEDLHDLSACASPRIMASHYRGIAKKTFFKKARQAEHTDIKAYLQMIRGLLAARWFVKNPQPGGFPPLDFNVLRNSLHLTSPAFPNPDKEIDKLVVLKRSRPEREINRKFPAIMQWAETEHDRLEQEIRDMPILTSDREMFELAFRNQYPRVFPEITDSQKAEYNPGISLDS